MKPSKSSGMYRPFEGLKSLLKKRSRKIPNDPAPQREDCIEINADEQDDRHLFLEAMADVKPISQNRVAETGQGRGPLKHSFFDAENDTLVQLENLVKHGEGFVVAHTPEYIEGTGYQINPEVTKRLHRGDFSIQAHIDLHGHGVAEAREAFEGFIKDAVKTGKRGVLVVHGRGLSSPVKPVLKPKVYEWLTSSRWRKWVIAFTSARSCDGGAGATYVLLRQRPLAKRFRKRVKGKDISKD